MNPWILTLRLDEMSFEYFNTLRRKHFPRERNFIDAHLTLFHHLPANEQVRAYIEKAAQQFSQFTFRAETLMKLGGGVAFAIESEKLLNLHGLLRNHFEKVLTPQDLQPFRPHITIQNKVDPITAQTLYAHLSLNLQPVIGIAEGLSLHEYLGGPWRLVQEFTFQK